MKNKVLATLIIGSFFSFYQLPNHENELKRMVDKPEKSIVQERKIDKFKDLTVSNAIEVEVLEGGFDGKLIIKGLKNDLEKVSSEVINGNLVLKLKDEYRATQINNKIKVVFKNTDLNSINLSGASKFSSKPYINTKNFNIIAKGASIFSSNIDSYSINTNSSGASIITLSGKSKNIELKASGASKINFSFNDLEFLNVKESGSSNIVLTGSSKKIKIEQSGSSLINAENFKSDEIKIFSSGASSSTLWVSELISVDCSGSSHVKYFKTQDNIKIKEKTSGHLQ